MKKHSYLTFSLNNCLYGISTLYVEEIFSLPELTPSPKAYRDIVGVVNFRGYILPVMDLARSFGYQSPDYHLTDSVVVLKWEELRLGIIVNEVQALRDISPEEITTALDQDRELPGVEKQKIIAGIAKSAGDILILSNPENLFRYVESQQITSVQYSLEKEFPNSHNAENFQFNSSELLLTQQTVFCPKATPEEIAIFRDRADNLKLSVENEDLKNLRPLGVIALNNALFGIDLAMVREFTDIRKVTPIPCCPAHIIGNMNLRGEILTLVDIRGLLNLPLRGIADNSKAMVVEVEGIVAGVIVEEVCDVMFFLNPLEITAVPTAIHSINNEYLQGVAPYHEKMMSILDWTKILLNGGLIVDEAI